MYNLILNMLYECKSLEYILNVYDKLISYAYWYINKYTMINCFKNPHNSLIIIALNHYPFPVQKSNSQWQWKVGVMKELRLARFSLLWGFHFQIRMWLHSWKEDEIEHFSSKLWIWMRVIFLAIPDLLNRSGRWGNSWPIVMEIYSPCNERCHIWG